MATTGRPKSLGSRIVQTLLNTINRLQGHRHLSKEDAHLCNFLPPLYGLVEEIISFRDELEHHRQQVGKQATCNACVIQPSSQPPKRPVTNDRMPPNRQAYQAAPHSPEADEDAALRAEVDHYREKNAQLLERYGKLNEELKRKKIESFEDLMAHDKDAMKVLLELARMTEPIPLEGLNIAIFGLTSTGKSTMLNALLGQKVAETGVGETTTEITPYPASQFTLWDVPGRNDEVSYLSMEYIAFFKGLTRRLILIGATVKENSSMMKLLDELELDYDIVFNKFDKVDEEEQEEVKKQIQSEVNTIGLRGVKKIYFVSAKNPKMFNDWAMMVDHLTHI